MDVAELFSTCGFEHRMMQTRVWQSFDRAWPRGRLVVIGWKSPHLQARIFGFNNYSWSCGVGSLFIIKVHNQSIDEGSDHIELDYAPPILAPVHHP